MKTFATMLAIGLLVLGSTFVGAQQQGSQQQGGQQQQWGSPQQGSQQQDAMTMREAQERLKAEGFYTGQVDGIFGPKTEEALREYQQAQGLQVTGSLTQETTKKLMSGQQHKGGQHQSRQQQ